MAELCRAGDLDSHTSGKAKSVGQIWNRHQMEISERTVDAAALRFFGGKRECGTDENRSISVSGGRIDEHSAQLQVERSGARRRLGAAGFQRDVGSKS
jgi:hypothetical protein